MGCCSNSNWKREEKKDHRFDYLEIKDFHSNSFGCRMSHLYVFVAALRSFVVLGLDIYTAVGLLILKSYKSTVTQQTFIAHNTTKWIFAGCIILSVVLLIWDWIAAIRIIRSKNISFAFTNVIANRYYSITSYDHHCLFHKLESSSHRSNTVIFWVFFSFQGCMRLLFSEGPRQSINALTVFSVLSTRNFALTMEAYADITPFQWTVLGFMGLSLLIWLFSFVRFCMAALLFPFLLCHIQGGLTEFVVRKIDGRIEKIIEKARRKRLERYAHARRAEDNVSVSGSRKGVHQKTGSIVTEKPTLPKIPMLDEKVPAIPTAYAVDSDNESLFSNNSLAKSSSAYNLSNYPLTRSETLPLYRSDTQEHLQSRYQTEPTLPAFPLNSPPRLSNKPATFRAAPGQQTRPQVATVPSYHQYEQPRPGGSRNNSYGPNDSAPRYTEDGRQSARSASHRLPPQPGNQQGPSRFPQSASHQSLRSDVHGGPPPRRISPSASHQSLQSNRSLTSQQSGTTGRPRQSPPAEPYGRPRQHF